MIAPELPQLSTIRPILKYCELSLPEGRWYLCAQCKVIIMTKRRISTLSAVLAGAAVGIAIGTYLATGRGKLLQKRILDYLSLQAHQLQQKAFEHLWHSLPPEWLTPVLAEEEPSSPQSEPEGKPAASEKSPLTAEDIRNAFQVGVARARQRLAEKWSEREK